MSWLPALALLVVAAAGYIEVVEDGTCQDGELRLTCRRLHEHIAVIEARFLHNESCGPPSNPGAHGHSLRAPLNRRCSGVNHCSFNLTQDYALASTLGSGAVRVTYACADDENTTGSCHAKLTVEGEGFVHSPGYPKYYLGETSCSWLLQAKPGQKLQVSFLDVSLRGIGPLEENCKDRLEVFEGSQLIYNTCGDEDIKVITSQGNSLNVTVTAASKTLYPKRGVLFHYKALGCLLPPTPQDGYLVYKNDTDAEYMCCVGYLFPDTQLRSRSLHCKNGNAWDRSLPDCINTTMEIWRNSGHVVGENITNYQMAAMTKESDLMFDVLLPTMIICVLLVGNGVVLFIIFRLRKRRLQRYGDEEEIGAIYQPQDNTSTTEKAINV